MWRDNVQLINLLYEVDLASHLYSNLKSDIERAVSAISVNFYTENDLRKQVHNTTYSSIWHKNAYTTSSCIASVFF